MSDNSSAYMTVCAIFDFSDPEKLTLNPYPYKDPHDTVYYITTSQTKIYNKDIQLDFNLGEGVGGVIIRKSTIDYDGKPYSYWYLEIRSGAHIIVNALNGCTLDSIVFEGTDSFSVSSNGTYYSQEKTWRAKTTTNTTEIENGFHDCQHFKIKVYYRKNSSQVDYVPSSQDSGQEIEYFDQTDIKFSPKLSSDYNKNGVTLNNNKLTPTLKGSVVTLKSETNQTKYGGYNINVAKGTFMSVNGDIYDTIQIPFKINPKRDIIDYTSSSQSQVTYNKLPTQIILMYNQDINVPKGQIGYVYKGGVRQFPVQITTGGTRNVIISHSNTITESGVYTFEIPAKAIRNSAIGDVANEYWNPEIAIRYIVNSSGTDVPSDSKTAYITFKDNNTDTLTVENGTVNTVRFKVNNVSNIQIKDPSLPYITKVGSTGSSNLKLYNLGNSELSMDLSGLGVGTYKLYIPIETFKYSEGDVVGMLSELMLTITPNSTPNIKYDYPGAIETKDNFPPNPYRNVYAVEWLNHLVYFTMADSLTFNPDARVELVNINGAHIRSGHFEEYPNYKYETNNCDWCGDLGLKIVFDPPLDEGECKLLSGGTYFLEVPKGAVGDSNYGKWLKDHSFTGECHANNKFYVSYFLNNKILEM